MLVEMLMYWNPNVDIVIDIVVDIASGVIKLLLW